MQFPSAVEVQHKDFLRDILSVPDLCAPAGQTLGLKIPEKHRTAAAV